jgi:oxygen-independent coproporphyrinogen-3 oxidase
VLIQEIKATPNLGSPLRTIFFGGGTPSLLAVSQVEEILTALATQFGLVTSPEISMEMDPGTFSCSSLQALRDLGINRVSLGVQAFQDELLAACGRTHCVADIHQAVADLVAVAMPVWSLDLISGLPHQTLTHWEKSLTQAIALTPHHLSIYDLTVEPGTVFAKRYVPGVAPLPTDTLASDLYRVAQALLTQAGYEHYEISNYAQSGYQCQHNRVYWENRAYYGFGMGATSYTQTQRFARPRTTHEYKDWVATYQAQQGKLDCPPTPISEQWLDTLMVGLRLATGVDCQALKQTFGAARVDLLIELLTPYQQQGWVEFDAVPATWLRLTDPEGFLFSNVILVKLFETFGTD